MGEGAALPRTLLDATLDYQSDPARTAVTFHDQAARAARRPKVVRGHAGVTPRVRLGDVDNPEAPVVQHGDSGKTADAEVLFF